MLEIGAQHIQTGKLALHIAQGVLIFVTFCLDITVFRSSAKVDGRLGWNFGVVSLPFLQPSTLPFVILLIVHSWEDEMLMNGNE
jgi:hypothetical protein